MSSQHRKPLLAFVLVLIVCGLIVLNAVRAQAATGPGVAPEQPSTAPAALVARVW